MYRCWLAQTQEINQSINQAHNVKEKDDVEFMALKKQLGGKSLEDFHLDATMKLINSHSCVC